MCKFAFTSELRSLIRVSKFNDIEFLEYIKILTIWLQIYDH